MTTFDIVTYENNCSACSILSDLWKYHKAFVNEQVKVALLLMCAFFKELIALSSFTAL